MLKKTLILFGISLITYSLLVTLFPAEIQFPQNVQQGNFIKAEEYFYDPAPYPIVLVGSSMGYRLNKDLLPDSCLNLCMSGGSPFTGLALIKLSKKIPKVILIETNVLMMKENKELISDFSSPFHYYCLKYFPLLRQKNQIVTYASNWGVTIAEHVTRKKIVLDKHRNIPCTPEALARVNQKLREKERKFDPERLSEAMLSLGKELEYFRQRGTKIIFF